MSKLFKDALDDARKLREIAEQNATNKIIEAVAPRIKALVEQELLDDEDEFTGDDMPGDIDIFDDGEMELPETAADDLVSDVGATLPSEQAPIDLGAMADATTESTPTEFSFEKDGKQVKVAVTVESNKRRKVVDIKKMSASKLLRALNETKNSKLQRAILIELAKIRKELKLLGEAGDKNSQIKLNALNLLLKENIVMRRKNSSRRLSESAWWLLREQEEEEGGDAAEGGDEAAEGGDDAEMDVAAASSALEDLGAALGLEIEVEAEEGDDDEGGDDEEGGEDEDEFDFDLEEADHDETYEMDEMMKELEEMDKDEMMKAQDEWMTWTKPIMTKTKWTR